MRDIQIRPVILWCLRIILILQAALFMPSLPEIRVFPAPLSSIILPSLLCCAFAAGVLFPWKNRWYFIFDLLIPACAVFLFPGRAFLMCFAAGALLKMDLADDADCPVSLPEFANAFCWGLGVFLVICWLAGDTVCRVGTLILLSAAIFCNHASCIREKGLIAAVPFLLMIAGLWFAPVPAERLPETAFSTQMQSAEMDDSEMLPLLAIQVLTNGKVCVCAEEGSFSASVFKEARGAVLHPDPDCGLYYYELSLPRSVQENTYFTRSFYENILRAARDENTYLAVRVPLPMKDPREKQIASVIAATLPGKTAQLYGPSFRYFVVRKDGALPDLSPELFFERLNVRVAGASVQNKDFAAAFAALQHINYPDLPGGVSANTQDDPQLLAVQGIKPPTDNGIRDFLQRHLLWIFISSLAVYLLCRYFINWSPGHKPVFHFMEKGICCGGAAAIFFADWRVVSAADRMSLLSRAGVIMLLVSILSRIRNRTANGIALVLAVIMLFQYGFTSVSQMLVFFLMCGLLVIDHRSIRERFFLREEQLPGFYCIAVFAGAMAFMVISCLLFLLPGLTDILLLLLTALILCYGIYSFHASVGKRNAAP